MLEDQLAALARCAKILNAARNDVVAHERSLQEITRLLSKVCVRESTLRLKSTIAEIHALIRKHRMNKDNSLENTRDGLLRLTSRAINLIDAIGRELLPLDPVDVEVEYFSHNVSRSKLNFR